MDIWEKISSALIKYDERELTKLLQAGEYDWAQISKEDLDIMYTSAFQYSNETFLELLMSYGAPVYSNLFRSAIESSHVRALDLLLQYSTDEMKRTLGGLVHYALLIKSSETLSIIEVLMKHGYAVDININERYTLLAAIHQKNIDIIDKLLMYGANPLIKFDCGLVSTLDFAFVKDLPTLTREKIVKYAVLYNLKDRNEKKFFQNFRAKKARPFLKFAKSCVAEVRHLKVLKLNSNDLTLFDFIISQGEQFNVLLDDFEITKRLLHILSSTSLPIYKLEILRKVGKNYVLSSFSKLSCIKCSVSCKGIYIYLNSDCIASICKFLSAEDVFSFWMAITKL